MTLRSDQTTPPPPRPDQADTPAPQDDHAAEPPGGRSDAAGDRDGGAGVAEPPGGRAGTAVPPGGREGAAGQEGSRSGIAEPAGGRSAAGGHPTGGAGVAEPSAGLSAAAGHQDGGAGVAEPPGGRSVAVGDRDGRAGAAEPPGGPAGAAGSPGGRAGAAGSPGGCDGVAGWLAGRARTVVEVAGHGAVWAVGGPEGAQACGGDPEAGFDVGGLTAVLAVWPVIGSLVGQGELALHTPLTAYGADAAAGLSDGTTTHHLLTHSGGLPALTRLAEHLCGSPLDHCAATRIWEPLGMTRTRFADGTLRAPLSDLVRFLCHLLSTADHPITRAWTAESLRIRTGELTPARGLLWHPAPSGVWSHGEGPAVWIAPRRGRWAALLPTAPAAPDGTLRTAFREAVFGTASMS